MGDELRVRIDLERGMGRRRRMEWRTSLSLLGGAGGIYYVYIRNYSRVQKGEGRGEVVEGNNVYRPRGARQSQALSGGWANGQGRENQCIVRLCQAEGHGE